MITVKPGKDWRKARRLMSNYGKRMEWVRRQIIKNLADAFLKKLLAMAPKGKEYEEYRKSLSVVEITGIGKEISYAVVSDREAVSLDTLREQEGNPTVVYIESKKGRGQADPLVQLMSMNNPWPPNMIPHNLSEEVMLVHVPVTQPEYDFATDQAKRYRQENSVLFTRYGAKWSYADAQKADELTSLNSLPDYLSFALRAEFGLNIAPHPHWRPALRVIAKGIEELIDRNNDIQDALYDEKFRKHLESQQQDVEQMPVKKFEDEAKVFQEKIGSVVGAGMSK